MLIVLFRCNFKLFYLAEIKKDNYYKEQLYSLTLLASKVLNTLKQFCFPFKK